MEKTTSRVVAVIAALGFSVWALAQEKAFEPVDLPDHIAAKVAGLAQEKIDYIRGPRIFGFAGSHELLFDRFKNKSPDEIETYIDAMIRVQELMLFNPETDMASIPLSTDNRGFNSWKALRPAEFDTPRDAGPININRYLRAGPKQGIPTFFNLPLIIGSDRILPARA